MFIPPISGNDIYILAIYTIDKKELESFPTKVIKVIFLYHNQPIVIESFVHSKMLNISKIFSDTYIFLKAN